MFCDCDEKENIIFTKTQYKFDLCVSYVKDSAILFGHHIYISMNFIIINIYILNNWLTYSI